MSEQAQDNAELRTLILEDPKLVLNDRDVMRALVSADNDGLGKNVVDLKTVVMQKLETRLNQMEEHQQSLLAAAYDNVASTTSIHKAVLDLLEPKNFTAFLGYIAEGLSQSLNVDVARLCLEAPKVAPQDMVKLKQEFGEGVVFLEHGEIDYYLTLGRDVQPRPITLRPISRGVQKIHGPAFEAIQSEALLKIDLGTGNRPGLLVLASNDDAQFGPRMGTDLIVFYGSVFEKVLQGWLANE